MKKIFLLTSAFILISFTSFAQSAVITDSEFKREKIRSGHHNSTLSDRETRRLHRQVNKLDRHKKIATADGRLTRRERKSFHLHSQKVDRHIRAEKRDRNKY